MDEEQYKDEVARLEEENKELQNKIDKYEAVIEDFIYQYKKV